MMSNGMGRSPFPSRSRRRHDGTPTMDDSNSTPSANGSSFGSPFMIGQGLVQARISPASSAWSERRPRRFFDNATPSETFKPEDGGVLGTAIPPATGPANANSRSNNNGNSSSNQQQTNSRKSLPSRMDKATTAKRAQDTIDEESVTMDGINLTTLRKLAQECMGNSFSLVTSSPSMAVFYASILYSKTLALEDTFLYAQALANNGEAKRCVRLLEQAQLLSNASPIRVEAVLLASEALAALEEWQSVLHLLEDASNSGDHWSPNLEDDDEIGWDSLAKSLSCPPNYIHPIARLCLCRGRAYSETGHPMRAALFWKRALVIDPMCVQALDCLLGRSVVTARQAYDVIVNLKFPPDMDWLRNLYLARVDLSPQDGTPSSTDTIVANHKHIAGAETSMSTPLLNGQEASSIQLMTPSFQQHGDLSNDSIFFGDNHPESATFKTPMGPAVPTVDTLTSKNSNMQNTVEKAFEKLWGEHKLQKSSEVLAMAARRAYRRYDLQNSLKYCQELGAVDPLCQTAGFVYVATLVALGHKRLLFRLAHEWVEASPKSARAWFAVGAYYFTCDRFHVAQRHFCRATRLDPHCTEAWIAFGCSFAACDESDQALASFRAAQRLAPGEHSSLLYIGMEYLRTNHLVLAQHFLTAAFRASGGDPVCLNELGVLAFQQQDYSTAIRWFLRAIQASVGGDVETEDCIGFCQDKYWEPTIFNLGQAYRKARRFEEAVHCFGRCLTLLPDNASSYSALAFTKHLMGDLDGAIEYYHQSLSRKPDDPFSSEMLNRALKDALQSKLFLEDVTPFSPVLGKQAKTRSKPLPKDLLSPESYAHAPQESMMTDDGISLSVDDSGDVDMNLT